MPRVLHRWLATTTLEEFTSHYLQRAPLARPSSACDATRVDWALLGRVLPRARDVLVVRRGELLEMPPPRTLGKLVEGFRVGTGIVVRGAEQLAPELAALRGRYSATRAPRHRWAASTTSGCTSLSTVAIVGPKTAVDAPGRRRSKTSIAGSVR